MINNKKIIAPAGLLMAALTLSSCTHFLQKEFIMVGGKRYLIAKVHEPTQPDKVIEYQVFNEKSNKYYRCGETRKECLEILREDNDYESVPDLIRKPKPKPEPSPPSRESLGPVLNKEDEMRDSN